MWAPGGDDLAAPETRERKWGASAAGHRGSAPSLRKARDLPTPAWGPRGSGSQREAGRRAENVRVVSESVERDGKHSRTQRSAPLSSPRPRAAHPSPSASSGVYLCQFPPPFGRFLHRVPGDRVCGARAPVQTSRPVEAENRRFREHLPPRSQSLDFGNTRLITTSRLHTGPIGSELPWEPKCSVLRGSGRSSHARRRRGRGH